MLTPTEIAGTLGAALGHGLRYVEAPISVAESYSPDLAAMFRWFGSVGMSVDVEGLRRDYPELGWHRFAEWANAHLTA